MTYVTYKKNELRHLKVSDMNMSIPNLQNSNKTETIANLIMKSIDAALKTNVAKIGDLLPKKSDLAYYLGVSLGTIQNVLKILEDKEYIYSKQKIGSIIKDKNDNASELRKRTSKKDMAEERIKNYILTNKMEVGSQMPATRQLAREINMTVNTVMSAISKLITDGIVKYDEKKNLIVINNQFIINENADEAADAQGYVRIKDAHKDVIKEDLKTLADTSLSNKDRKVVEKRLKARLLEATGADNQMKLKHADKAIEADSATVLDDFFRLTKAFREKTSSVSSEKLVSRIKSFGKYRAVLGLGLAMALSCATQPINVYLTKKRTGSDGFAGMPDRKKDNTNTFKLMKLGAAASMAALALATMKAKPSQVLSKIMYKAPIPSMDQIKALFGATIISRMFRESKFLLFVYMLLLGRISPLALV